MIKEFVSNSFIGIATLSCIFGGLAVVGGIVSRIKFFVKLHKRDA